MLGAKTEKDLIPALRSLLLRDPNTLNICLSGFSNTPVLHHSVGSKERPCISEERVLTISVNGYDFLDWVKGSFFFGKRHKEAPDSKNLSPDAERIKGEIRGRYRVTMDELHQSRRGIANEPRNVAIYLLRSLRGDNLEEIGREFNITRFSSVSSVVERMRKKISRDRQLRRRVEEIKTAIYMSQA